MIMIKLFNQFAVYYTDVFLIIFVYFNFLYFYPTPWDPNLLEGTPNIQLTLDPPSLDIVLVVEPTAYQVLVGKTLDSRIKTFEQITNPLELFPVFCR